ncbi:MAG: heme exporter protein CcmD [Rhodocyclaceae bacterium]|jgi:heme exporter protein D|nr:heme exporter protein CcmD [Rhodocyclaceae bacterium]
MNWNSPAEFFAMGGYALYVWGSFGVTALCMIVEPLLARKRRCDAVNSLRREIAANKEDQ